MVCSILPEVLKGLTAIKGLKNRKYLTVEKCLKNRKYLAVRTCLKSGKSGTYKGSGFFEKSGKREAMSSGSGARKQSGILVIGWTKDSFHE